MIENDTIKLLRECDSGTKMGIKSISDVIDKVESEDFKKILNDSKLKHEKLENEIQDELIRFKDDGKDPSMMLTGMSKIKTNIKIGLDNEDSTIAELIIDGCNMGVKSLNKYLNQYKSAEEYAKDITKKLINTEQQLSEDLRDYL
ncbi:MAG: DUF2383 domain-containing protein [Ruminococcaceae bacterium]|nr:DUF2383 domain-containing protein [Oscillospiraceae bacterium]